MSEMKDVREPRVPREYFEAWTKTHPAEWDLRTFSVNGEFHHYIDSETDAAWMGFQAAWNRRAALEPAPKPAGGEWVTVPHPDQTSPMTVGPEEFLDEPEAAAWDWLDKTFANAKLGHHPNDRDYSPDEMVDAFIAGRASINVAAPPSPAASPSSGEVVEALKLHVAYEALPTDRGGKNGPKGQAWQAFIAARDAALAKIGGDHDK